MTIARARLLVAVGVALGLGVMLYLAATIGVRYVVASSAESDARAAAADGPGSIPAFVYHASETVPLTSGYGPPGPVAMVFAGTEVVTGLSGELRHPWIVVASHTGGYRALDTPHLPPATPGAVSLSPDGSQLAWGWEGGVVVYDAVTNHFRELGADLGPRPATGDFSPDGRHLLVRDPTLRVLDLASGDVIATLEGIGEAAARQVVWTPDGGAVTYVANGRLVTQDWQRGTRSQVAIPLGPDATLAWAPTGDRLAAMRSTSGGSVVDVFDMSEPGRAQRISTLSPEGYSLERLLGFTSDNRVSVIALRLETGPIEVIYGLSVSDEVMTELAQLPGPGRNWVDSATMRIAAEALANGSVEHEEPWWPWGDRAALVACVIAVLFSLGLFLTRRPSRKLRRS
jgi:DNA-binding beta-propeller fold protein YncE